MLEVAAFAGMSEREFWHSTPIFLSIASRVAEKREQAEWERSRYVAFWTFKTVSKVRKPQDLTKFPWEQKAVHFEKQDVSVLKKFDQDADEVLRLTQPEVYQKYMEAKLKQNGSN